MQPLPLRLLSKKLRESGCTDARAYDQPQWLKNKFVDRHTEVIENTNEPALPYYELYSAPFEAGEVCLGGNDADGKSRNILAPWVVIL